MEEQRSLSWWEILPMIVVEDSPKCAIRLLDTVFIKSVGSSSEITWYFTTKNGTIAKKKRDKCSVDAVLNRFCRFALANPNNREKVVGVIIGALDYSREYLNENRLENVLKTPDIELHEGDYLQVFLRALNGKQLLVCGTCVLKDGKYDITVSTKVYTIYTEDSTDVISFATAQVKFFCFELLNLFNYGSDLSLKELEIECILDDNKHVWLSSVSRCIVGSNNSQNREISDIPTSASVVSNSISNSLPGLGKHLKSAETNKSPRGLDTTVSVSHSASKLLSRIEGGAVNICLKEPEELPGLRAWILDAVPSGFGSTNLDWHIDLDAYNQLPSPNPNIESVRKQRSSMRKNASSWLLALIRLSEPILLGQDVIETEKEFIDKWKSIFDSWIASLVITDSSLNEKSVEPYSQNQINNLLKNGNQVTVDGNCHAVCQKLNSLVEAEFKAHTKQLLGGIDVVLPRSISRGANGISSSHVSERLVVSAQQSGRPDNSASGNTPPLQPEGNVAWNDDNLSLVSSLSGDKYGGQIIYETLNSKAPKDLPTKTKKKKNSAKQSAVVEDNSNVKNNNSASVEMLAKFAAAKEM